ncbi:MAG: RluA family pseudouridine synthase [Myxococcota bacterium]
MAKGTTEHTVGVDEAGVRLDKVLAGLDGVGSRERARQVLGSGKVTVDGELVGAGAGGRKVPAGTQIAVRWNTPGTSPRRVAAREALARTGVAILHEDDALLVANKPVGLLTDAATRAQSREHDTLRKRVGAWLRTSEVWPAHRIDRDTSGVVAFAKTPEARQSLHDQWVARTPLRAYLVLVEGAVEADAGHLADWMWWDAKQRRQRPARPRGKDAWLAEADFTVVRRFEAVATQLAVTLVTGRRNQIRLHAQRMGHPLIGERMYRPPGSMPATVRFERQALHASRLGFDHPTDGRPVTFEAPLPKDLARLIRHLGTAASVR